MHSRVPLGYLITDGQGPSFQLPSRYPSPPTLHKCHIMCPKYSLGLLSFPGTFWGTPWQLYNWWLTRDFFSVLSKQEQTKFDDLRRRMCQICANIFFCAIGADLQPCTLKNHYFAPHTTGFRAVGQPLREHLPGFWAREARAAADRGDEKGSREHKSFSVSLFRRPEFSTAAAAAEIGRREEAQRKKKRKKSFPSLFSRSRDKVRRGINYTE